MPGNVKMPCLLKLKDGVNAIHLRESVDAENTVLIPSSSLEQVVEPYTKLETHLLDNNLMEIQEVYSEQINYVYEIVYPDQLNLKPVLQVKRGRPRKKKIDIPPSIEPPKAQKPMPVPRTRSGRPVRFPKHIEQNFEKVNIYNDCNDLDELKTSEFTRYEVINEEPIKEEVALQFPQRKRNISAQFKCPTCNKAYLGKKKMLEHIRKNPDHGPVRNEPDLNFDVWNYLVDVTQKCPPALRGIKFCEELTNLLHNVLLLTSALFKEVELNKSHVEVDKVLGNAIGLPPGIYKFNDSELYKDVTVLKLITNTDFFKRIDVPKEKTVLEGQLTTENLIKKKEGELETVTGNSFSSGRKQEVVDTNIKESKDCNNIGLKQDKIVYDGRGSKGQAEFSSCNGFCIEKQSPQPPQYPQVTCTLQKKPPEQPVATILSNNDEPPSLDLSITQNDLEKMKHANIDAELLSDNSLLNLPNLILPGVEGSGNILDNSTSSDEVMNVDQFVNERFKKITEPDLEISGLDLPSLDLFQFHTS